MKVRAIYKNYLTICFSFFVLFVAFNGVQSLQSSIHCEDGLGTAALTSIYAGFVVGSLFLPTITIQRFGLKWTMEMD